MDISKSVRRQIAVFASSSRTRTIGWPAEWKPGEVRRPDGESAFTDPGAWEFIAALIETDHPVEEVELTNPAGKKGYVMLVDMGTEVPLLYIKVQMGSGRVIGRSFHYSHHGRGVHEEE